MICVKIFFLIRLVFFCGFALAEPLRETLPSLGEGDAAPQSVDEMWRGFDPRAEPLDVEVLAGWEEDGVVFRVLRYRAGIFKGQKAMIAAIYGYPKGAKKLPGLVQIHGGGQYADSKAVLTNAKRGYATISIAWAGRLSSPKYTVNPDGVKLFWEGEMNDPNYRVTTDWGAVDAYHAPCRNPKNNFLSVKPAEWTLDKVESPRNCPWFLCTLAARRALTFLEQQPEVDGERLGVYGHSMGGKLTVMTAGSDDRVKAAAPSCGGISDLESDSPLFLKTIADDVFLTRITCPIIFLSPSNDFHGRIGDLEKAVHDIQTDDWRVTCSPHHNHQDTPPYEVATQLWFDEQLKGAFQWPAPPKTSLVVKEDLSIMVEPDSSRRILGVDFFYTQQGKLNETRFDFHNTKHRFWHHRTGELENGVAKATLPLLSLARPVWVYANIRYALDEPVTGAGYYYGIYTAKDFNLSSVMRVITPEQLKAGGVKVSDKRSMMIEDFEGDWKKEWFSYRPESDWAISTHKLYDPKWAAPEGGKLVFEVKCEMPNMLVVRIDDFCAEVELEGGNEWQRVELVGSSFRGGSDFGWIGVKTLKLAAKEIVRQKDPSKNETFGGVWKGIAPEFKNLHWEGSSK
jgi:cephalosporin-C deacetylase-like acetyl esterase